MEQMDLPELDYMKHPERVKAKKRLDEAVDMLVTVFETDSPSLTYLLLYKSLIANLKEALTNLAEVEAKVIEAMEDEE